MKYYFVSYSHPNGFGNAFFCREGAFLVRDAETWLKGRNPDLYRNNGEPVILSFQEITKAQYVGVCPEQEREEHSLATLTFGFGLFLGLIFPFLANL